ncbi:MAG: hypothetical protein JWR89_5151 [Tardiphaga sp.]|nr:hypothetical protein [Tardiphaga sp.]
MHKMFCNQTLTDCSFGDAVSGLRPFRYTSLNACTSEVTERASAASRSKLMHEPRNEPFWHGSLWRKAAVEACSLWRLTFTDR